MDDIKSITFRLESFFVQLADINRRWTAWLQANELSIIALDTDHLRELEATAIELHDELNQAVLDRGRLLEDAGACGLPATDLESLARRLPAWQKPSLRTTVQSAKQQLALIRRLHVATWVLLHQAFQLASGNMQLMIAGHAEQHAYLPSLNSDTGGGQLLDVNL